MTVTTTATRTLICAATRWEHSALSGLAGPKVDLLRTGMGPEAASRALLELPSASFGLAVSAGLAGALQEGMRPGDLVADFRGFDLDAVRNSRELARGLGLSLHLGPIAHSDVVLEDFAHKASFAAGRRAAAVDMETQAIRSWGQARGVPVIAVRAVLDGLRDRLPSPPYWKNLPLGVATGLKARRALRNLKIFLEAFLGQI